LFETRPLDWQAPDPRAFDAVLTTSAQAARMGGPGLAALTALPCYAVGETSAEAARAAGFEQVIGGDRDGAAALDLAISAGARRILHLAGLDHIPLGRPGVTVERRIVYAADAVTALPGEAGKALARGALVLLHSPRAAALIASFVPERGETKIAAISAAAAAAAGQGWAAKAVAAGPRDEALLELAVKLCQTAAL
jgi:uroporphyrinogen-III synthase